MIGLDYKNCKIVNIRRGKGVRSRYVYAEVRRVDTNELLVSATLDYCTKVVSERLP